MVRGLGCLSLSPGLPTAEANGSGEGPNPGWIPVLPLLWGGEALSLGYLGSAMAKQTWFLSLQLSNAYGLGRGLQNLAWCASFRHCQGAHLCPSRFLARLWGFPRPGNLRCVCMWAWTKHPASCTSNGISEPIGMNPAEHCPFWGSTGPLSLSLLYAPRNSKCLLTLRRGGEGGRKKDRQEEEKSSGGGGGRGGGRCGGGHGSGRCGGLL